MIVIWKQALKPMDIQEISIPEGAEILCASEQFEQICVWFRCDDSKPKSSRWLAIVGTGHVAPTADQGRYLGTASLHGGSLIKHVFECPTAQAPRA